jgi:hypothetical protein
VNAYGNAGNAERTGQQQLNIENIQLRGKDLRANPCREMLAGG